VSATALSFIDFLPPLLQEKPQRRGFGGTWVPP